VTRLATLVVGIAFGAAALAGCGGGGGDQAAGGGGGDTSGETANTPDEFVPDSPGPSAAFRSGKIYCGLYPLEELARQNGVAAKAEVVARAYSKLETGAKDREDAYKGCLAGIKGK
jgi:hypothetical protein